MARRALIGLAVSAVCVYVLLSSLDLGAVWTGLLQSNLLSLIPALALFFGGVWLRTVRWRYLLRPLKDVATGALFRTIVVGFTVNNIMPVRLGEVARAIILSRHHGVPAAATLGTILVERFFDGLALCGFLALGLWMLPEGANRPEWLLLVATLAGAVFVAAVVVGWALASWPKPFLALAERLLVLAPARFRARILNLLTSFVTGFQSLRDSSVVVPVAALSIGAWALEAGMYYVLLHGFNIAAGPVAALIGAAAANLGTMIPSSPGYVGTFDVPLQQVLTGVFGVPPELATSYTLVVHAALIVPVVVLGLAFLASMDLSLRQVSRASNLRSPREPGLTARPTGSASRAFANSKD